MRSFESAEKRRHLWHYAILIAVCCAVYSYSLKGGFLWDDETIVLDNPLITASSFIAVFLHPVSVRFPEYYRPLQILSYKLDYALWGFNAFGFHLTSVVVHVFNAVLLYAIIARVSSPRVLSLFSALLFGVHPLLAEPVNYISSRSDVLCGFFLLSSMLLYLKIRESGYKDAHMYGAAACFICALLCKESAVVFPLILLAYNRLIERRGIARVIPFFAAAVIFAGAKAALFSGGRHIGSQVPLIKLAFTDLTILARYCAAVFIPWGLHKNWIIPMISSATDPRLIAPCVIFAGTFLVWWKVLKKLK